MIPFKQLNTVLSGTSFITVSMGIDSKGRSFLLETTFANEFKYVSAFVQYSSITGTNSFKFLHKMFVELNS